MEAGTVQHASHLFWKETIPDYDLIFCCDTGISWYHWIQPGEQGMHRGVNTGSNKMFPKTI